MPRHKLLRLSAFTLIELSIVILVIALLTAAALRYKTSRATADKMAELAVTMDTIEEALMTYRVAYSRLPCPADITLAESTANFGKEVGTPGNSSCTGYNYINSGTDPDNADGLYDSAIVSKVVGGGVPTKTLGLPDKFAYDPWGRKLFFAVDRRITQTSAFINYLIYPTGGPLAAGTVGAITVKKTSADTLANSLTYKGVYVLISYGKNGHGGYVRNLGGTPVRYNQGSTNTDEQKNCHCTSAAVAGTFDRLFIQKERTTVSGSATNYFDDIVRYKTRQQMPNYTELQ